jgi:hypothetical protein
MWDRQNAALVVEILRGDTPVPETKNMPARYLTPAAIYH